MAGVRGLLLLRWLTPIGAFRSLTQKRQGRKKNDSRESLAVKLVLGYAPFARAWQIKRREWKGEEHQIFPYECAWPTKTSVRFLVSFQTVLRGFSARPNGAKSKAELKQWSVVGQWLLSGWELGEGLQMREGGRIKTWNAGQRPSDHGHHLSADGDNVANAFRSL